jgi:hypothetical protein
VSAPAEPELGTEQRAELERGVRQFNEGYFFECHDTLEELWSGLRGPGRDFFQGLIQVSVAFYHLGNGNRSGALSMLERAQRRFGGYPDRWYGFDLAVHRAELGRWQRRIAADDLEGVSRDELPVWRFEPAPSTAPAGSRGSDR